MKMHAFLLKHLPFGSGIPNLFNLSLKESLNFSLCSSDNFFPKFLEFFPVFFLLFSDKDSGVCFLPKNGFFITHHSMSENLLCF